METPAASSDTEKIAIDALSALMRARRTVMPKQFSGEPVSREEIEILLENANWAPNHGRTEPWRFFVFTGEGRLRLGRFLQETYRALTPEADFDPEKFDKLARKCELSSAVIAFAMVRGDKPKIPEIEEIEATACAVQNLWLSAGALGLAGYWSSPRMVYAPEMRDFLGLRPEDKPLGVFYLGRPGPRAPRRGVRGPAADKTVWLDA